MRVTCPLMLFFAVAMAAGGCARSPGMRIQMAAVPAPHGIDNVIYGSIPTPSYAEAAAPVYAMSPASGYGMAAAPYPTAVPPSYATMAAPPYAPAYATAAAPAYATMAAPPYAHAYATAAAPAYAMASSPYGTVAAPASVAMATGYPAGMVAAAPVAYAPTVQQQQPYTLDSGDRLRIVVFGQDGLTNSYVLDASGNIDMPLIGMVAARGLTSDQLSARIAGLLRQGFMREPHVAVEIEAYRPFFILGEVAQPGQYPYVANMSVETAVAIAGGFGPRGDRSSVIISRNYDGQMMRFRTPVTAPIRPGDMIQVQERWF
jgi:protein involved in polysaccharide export with SLBB domain